MSNWTWFKSACEQEQQWQREQKGKNTMSKYKYTTKGPVRGCCGHKHGSIRAAVLCLRRDQSSCRSQGGYSDRTVIRADGRKLDQNEYWEMTYQENYT